MAEEQSGKKISYFLKEATNCSVCSDQFHKEEMLSGRGRLIARDINNELRRNYDENPKFGKIYPSAYSLSVCPNCWHSAFSKDFNNVLPESVELLRSLSEYRKKVIQEIFAPSVVDFYEPRNLLSGAASYILGVMSYSFYPPQSSPTIKRGLLALRAAWLMEDLAKEFPDQKNKFFKVQEILYIKSKNYYNLAYELSLTNKERLEEVNLGPDTDKNYGYDGFMYIQNYLNFKMAYQEEDIMKKAEIYKEIRRNISRIFGVGKSSKEKPGPLLDIVRNLYDDVSSYLNEIEESLGIKLDD